MTDLQLQARALGDPTRHEVFRFVVGAGRPVGVAELTDHLGLNHNAVRQHLAKLVESGLLVEQTSPAHGRGRPRLVYTLHPAAEGRWGTVGPYERLALWLTEVVRTGDTPLEVGRRAGRKAARVDLDPGAAAADPVGALTAEMARHGFEPEVRPRRGGFELTLHACPFTSAAVADPATVCDLHLGLAQGVADSIPGIVVDELVTRDPRRATCRLRCHTE